VFALELNRAMRALISSVANIYAAFESGQAKAILRHARRTQKTRASVAEKSSLLRDLIRVRSERCARDYFLIRCAASATRSCVCAQINCNRRFVARVRIVDRQEVNHYEISSRSVSAELRGICARGRLCAACCTQIIARRKEAITRSRGSESHAGGKKYLCGAARAINCRRRAQGRLPLPRGRA
jgi:hypothetical protein